MIITIDRASVEQIETLANDPWLYIRTDQAYETREVMFYGSSELPPIMNLDIYVREVVVDEKK
jgi:hypothetical protein